MSDFLIIGVAAGRRHPVLSLAKIFSEFFGLVLAES
jgi:hypothetical protein